MFKKALELMEAGRFEEGKKILDGFLSYNRATDRFQGIVMEEFKKQNPSVEVLNVEIGNPEENVPAEIAWFKVTTKEHGWLHVYINKNSGRLEWY